METKNYTKEQLEKSQAILDEPDPAKRWRMMHDLLRETNPKAKREQQRQARAMRKVREAGLYNIRKDHGAAGLKFSVSIPNITWQALRAIDDRLRDAHKERYKTKDATNEIARDLARVFPEYKAS